VVHVLFGEAGDFHIGDGADNESDVHAATSGLHHLFAEDGAGHEIGGEHGDVGVGLAEHFDVAAGDLVQALDPVVAANAHEAFLFRDDTGEVAESFVFSGPVELPVRLGPHIAADDVQLERSLAFHEQSAVKPGGSAADVVVAVADVDSAGHGKDGVCDDHFVVQAAPEVEMAAFEQGPEPAEADAGGFPFADDLGREVLGGVTVEENVDLNLSAGGAQQGGGDESAGLVAVKNIGLQMDGICCLIDELYQGGEVVGTAMDQADFVVVSVAGKKSGDSSFRHRSDPSGKVNIGNF